LGQAGVKLGSSWVQAGIELGASWGLAEFRLGSSWGQAGVKLGSSWGQAGVNLHRPTMPPVRFEVPSSRGSVSAITMMHPTAARTQNAIMTAL